MILLTAKESGLSSTYIEEKDEKKKSGNYESNNDGRIFIAESNIINNVAYKESCVIIGRCADYILRDKKMF